MSNEIFVKIDDFFDGCETAVDLAKAYATVIEIANERLEAHMGIYIDEL